VNHKTAILIFTRTAREEARRKDFSSEGNSAVNLSISTSLINRTVREARKSRIPYFIISSDRQKGTSFGERFTNALKEVFDTGFENVIAIGNDSPQLNGALLQQAEFSLEKNEIVLGPDRRGGAYLIGISKKYFQEEILKNFRWNTSDLFSDFTSWIEEENISHEILNELSDINSASDLRFILERKNISFSFLRTLQSILASAIISSEEKLFPFVNPFLRLDNSRRGPPAV